MNRTIAVGAAVLLAVGVLVFALRGDQSPAPEPPEPPERAVNDRSPRPPARRAPQMPPPASFLVDDDVAGELRLEGQVIDAADAPVAGAEVTLDSNPPRSVTTEADGSFAFDELVGRRYTLVATASAGVGGPVTARLSETSEPVVLRLRTGASIEVDVVDAETRQPVPAATVELRGLMARTASADERGRARLAGLVAAGFELVAFADGYAPSREFLRLSSGDTERRTLALRRGAPLSGRVVAPDGTTPVAGALVTYEGVSDWRVRSDPRRDAVISAADGRFSIAALAAGTVRLTARHDEHASATTEPITLDGRSARSDVVIRLEASATVAGRVIDLAGEAVPYAVVRVAEDEGRRRGNPPRQTSADAAGRFEIGALPRRAVRLVALHDKATSDTVTVDLSQTSAETPAETSRREVELMLSVAGVIAGTVVDGDGEPVEGAQVMARPDFRRGAGEGFEFRLRGVPRELTDAGGRFEFGGLQDIDYVVVAVPAGVEPWGRGWRAEESESASPARVGDTELRLVLPADGGIKGKVAFEDGTVPESFLIATGAFGRGRPFSTSDGAFEVNDLAPGTYRLTVRGPGFEERSLSDVQVQPGQTTDAGTVKVRRGSVLSGRVVDANGRPVEGAAVQAGRRIFGSGAGASAGRRFGGGKSATTDADGRFTMRGLGAGRLSVVAEHETAGRSVPASATASGTLELVLQPFAAIEGTVTSGGAPVPDGFVQAQSKTVVAASFGVQTGPDGTYRFDRLAPDDYLLQVSAGRRGGPMRGMGFDGRSASVGPGETATVDIDIGGGEYTLVVRPVAKGAVDVVAQVTAVAGSEVSARTALQLEEQVGRRESGFVAFSFSSERGPARLSGLAPGAYTVCAVPYPAELEDLGDIRDYRRREGDDLPVYCSPQEVGGDTLEVAMDLPVELPLYVPASPAP